MVLPHPASVHNVSYERLRGNAVKMSPNAFTASVSRAMANCECVVLVWFNCAMVWGIFSVVSLRLLMCSSKIPFLYTFVLFVVCRPGQVSRICSYVSFCSLHILHFSCWYLFLKFALMSSILVLALKLYGCFHSVEFVHVGFAFPGLPLGVFK